jgi:hypothetical protein
MRREHLLIAFGLATLGALAVFLVGTPELPGAHRLVAEIASPAAGGSASQPEAVAAPSRPSAGAPAPMADDPQSLEARFREEVLRELERGSTAAPGAGYRAAPSPSQLRASVRVAAAETARPADTQGGEWSSSGGRDRDIDWVYLRDVFEGRVSGIPNETRAGLSLQEIDELGDIPYVEQLREEERYEELRELGFENETVPWPACLRTATCRRDRVSSPP